MTYGQWQRKILEKYPKAEIRSMRQGTMIHAVAYWEGEEVGRFPEPKGGAS